MFNAFDSYERHARVYPALLLSFPLIVACYSFSSFVNSPFLAKLTGSSAIVIVGVVLLSNVARYLGRCIEPRIWEDWGGPPSTRFLRKEDKRVAVEVKNNLYKKILDESKIDLQNELTDEKINQAFAFIRSFLRRNDKEGMWNKFNQEYGFARNLLGSKYVWVVFSFLMAGVCLLSTKFSPGDRDALIIGALLNFSYGLFAIFCGWVILPGLTKHIAERYAEEAIFSYLNTNVSKEAKE